MRFRLRTLLIVVGILPPILAGAWFGVIAYREWRAKAFERAMEKWMRESPGSGVIPPATLDRP